MFFANCTSIQKYARVPRYSKEFKLKKHTHSYIIFQKVTECEDLMDDPAMMESLKNAAKDLTADMMPVEMWDNLEVRHHLGFAF